MTHTDPRDFDTSPFDTGLTLEELDPARPRTLETPWGSFALFRVDDRILCVQSFCPHLGGPLFQGTISARDGSDARVTCPWHEWVFSLVTGERVDLAGRLLGRGPGLVRCVVERSPSGTIVLRAPDRRPGM